MPRRGENIRKRKDGRWEGRYIAGRQPDGRAIYRSVYGQSYAAARKKLIMAKNSAQTSDAVTAPEKSAQELLFSEVCCEWLSAISGTVRESTYVKYYNLCKNHIIPRIGRISCRNMTEEQLRLFLEEQRGKRDNDRSHSKKESEKYLSDSSVQTLCTIINAVLKYAASNKYMDALPAVTYRKERNAQIEILSDQDQKRLVRCMLREPDSSRIGILVCLYTGIRIGEICALKWDDIDTEYGTLQIRKTIQRIQNIRSDDQTSAKTQLCIDSPKSIHSHRMIPLPAFLCEIIDKNLTRIPGAYFLSGDPYKPMEPRTYQYRYKRYLREAGIRESNFHVLRHTFATQCVGLGFDVKSLSEILGHSSVSITMNKYVHPTLEMKREQMSRLKL